MEFAVLHVFVWFLPQSNTQHMLIRNTKLSVRVTACLFLCLENRLNIRLKFLPLLWSSPTGFSLQ